MGIIVKTVNREEIEEAIRIAVDLFNWIMEKVKEIFSAIKDSFDSVIRKCEKLNCNNYRKLHGMPMIKKRNKQTRTVAHYIMKGMSNKCSSTKKQKQFCRK